MGIVGDVIGHKITKMIAGGSGALAIAVQLISSQVSALDRKIDQTVAETHTYIDTKHDLVMVEVRHLNDGQSMIQKSLDRIESRMYHERKYNPGGDDENSN